MTDQSGKIEKTQQGNLAWRIFRPILVFLISLGVVAMLIFVAWKVIEDRFIMPVAAGDKTPITVEIKHGASTQTISKELEDSGVIRSAAAFKLYVDVFDQGAKLKAGVYEFNKSMTLEEIIEKMKEGVARAPVENITIPEGKTVEEIADILLKRGLLKDKNKFFELCRTGDKFQDYEFISSLNGPNDERRKYKLEGYLFPDTYQVYVDSTEEAIISKMLSRFNEIFSNDYIELVQEKGWTIDKVVTLASLIQKEAKPKDFKKVSAVFWNRLNKDKHLESCVTIHYILGIRRLKLSLSDIAADSPYNTYKYTGLPLGPVDNPGKEAIEAALNPDVSFMNQGYLYFCSKDPESGELAFSKTYEDHLKQVALYEPLWIAYDNAHK
ncbi:MAG: endolytic transglycosylase MltG [Bacillota bacterium]|nr:endolytic transglycosylase MltG [Bacillota bacterium]